MSSILRHAFTTVIVSVICSKCSSMNDVPKLRLIPPYLQRFFQSSSSSSSSTLPVSTNTSSSSSSTQARQTLDILAATSLNTCVNDGESVMNCSMKLVITGALSNGEDADGSGVLYYDLGQATSSSSSSSATTTLTNPRDEYESFQVLDALALVIYQSPIRLIYPLTYRRDYNDRPYEVVFTTDAAGAHFGLLNPCKDSPLDSQTGCGFMVETSADGTTTSRIPYSQGFCCRCSFSDTLTSYAMPRSGETCRFAEQHDSAHCLRMSSLWHASYEIGPPSLDFDIILTLVQCRPTKEAVAARKAATNNNNNDNTTMSLSSLKCTQAGPECECAVLDSSSQSYSDSLPALGPKQPTRCFPLPFAEGTGTGAGTSSSSILTSCDVQVDLQGTFAPYEGTPDFSDSLLLVPAYCNNKNNNAADAAACLARLVKSPSESWLIVDKAMFSGDSGGDCNKVGTSWEAFATQGNACNQPRGTCLISGQPADLYNADLLTLLPGSTRVPRYFLRTHKESSTTTTLLSSSSSSSTSSNEASTDPSPWGANAADFLVDRSAPGRALMFPTRRFQKSVVTLTLRADPESLRLVVNAAPGALLYTQATSLIGTQEQLAAMSGGIVLSILVVNTGAVASRFTVSVSCPSDFFLPIPARTVSLKSGGSVAAAFVDNQLRQMSGNATATTTTTTTSSSSSSLMNSTSSTSSMQTPLGFASLESLVASTLPAQSAAAFTFALQTITISTASVFCNVGLVNAIGNLLEIRKVNISITVEQPKDQGSQGGTHDDTSGGTGNPQTNTTLHGDTSMSSSGTTVCGTTCPTWYDIQCAVAASSQCVARISGLIGGMAGMALFASLFGVAMFKYPFLLMTPIRILLRMCCCCGNSSRNGDDRSESPVHKSHKNGEKHRERKHRRANNEEEEDDDDDDKSEVEPSTNGKEERGRHHHHKHRTVKGKNTKSVQRQEKRTKNQKPQKDADKEKKHVTNDDDSAISMPTPRRRHVGRRPGGNDEDRSRKQEKVHERADEDDDDEISSMKSSRLSSYSSKERHRSRGSSLSARSGSSLSSSSSSQPSSISSSSTYTQRRNQTKHKTRQPKGEGEHHHHHHHHHHQRQNQGSSEASWVVNPVHPHKKKLRGTHIKGKVEGKWKEGDPQVASSRPEAEEV